jgi:hypothetical protein
VLTLGITYNKSCEERKSGQSHLEPLSFQSSRKDAAILGTATLAGSVHFHFLHPHGGRGKRSCCFRCTILLGGDSCVFGGASIRGVV